MVESSEISLTTRPAKLLAGLSIDLIHHTLGEIRRVGIMQQIELKRVKKSFQWAIENKLIRFIVEKENEFKPYQSKSQSISVFNWLTIEYREPNGASPSEQGYTWKLLCAQRLSDYKTREHLINRITLMLASKISQVTQDINIINTDYTLVRKSSN